MFGESVFLFSVFSSLFLFFENGANILKNARNIWNDMRVKNVKFKKNSENVAFAAEVSVV